MSCSAIDSQERSENAMVERPRKRRWTQFGVGTLLLIVAVFAIWFGRAAYLARQQRQAIHLIEELGGTIVFDHAYEGSDEPGAPARLRQFLGDEYFRRIQGVAIVSEDFLDDHLAELARLGDLKVLRFHSSKVTDDGIRWLRKCEQLESLEIRWASITDPAMADIANLKTLKELWLLNTRVGDDGLGHLVGHPRLSTLIVGNFVPHEAEALREAVRYDRYSSPISDGGLQAIAKIPSLTSVDLMMCRETSNQRASFARERPNVKLTGGTGYTKVPPGYLYPSELPRK
jgi:hypothetical protein